MQHQIDIDGRPVQVELTEAARDALSRRTLPLVAEMELYFSCLIRKQVRFRDGHHHSEGETCHALVNDRLCVQFRPVMTAACGKDYEGDEPPLTDFPIVKARAYVPHWLRIDYRNGQWQGEFGYRSAS